MGLTNKRRAFIGEYLKDFNATQAAIRAGYSARTAYSISNELLRIPEVAEAIQANIDERVMSPSEVLTRLAEHARGDMGEFLDIESMSFDVNLFKAKEKNLTRLIHKVKQRTITTVKGDEETETNIVEIELYNAQAALIQIAKHHGLIVDKHDITTGGEPINLPDERLDRAVLTLADALREAVSSQDAGEASLVDATEQTPMAGAPEQGR